MRVGMLSLEWYFIYLLILASVHGFMHETSDFLLYNNRFIYQVLCTLIYHRHSLYSFLLHSTVHIHWYHNNTGTFKSLKVSTKLTKWFFKVNWWRVYLHRAKIPTISWHHGRNTQIHRSDNLWSPLSPNVLRVSVTRQNVQRIKNRRQNSTLLITIFHTNGVR